MTATAATRHPTRPVRSHAKMRVVNPATLVVRNTYMRAVCASSMKSGSKATAAVSARFHSGVRKRRPEVQVSTINSTPHSADGKRNAHSLLPKTATQAAMRYSWARARG